MQTNVAIAQVIFSVPHPPGHYSGRLLTQIPTEYCAKCDKQKNIYNLL